MSDEYRSENTEETGYPSLDEAEETMHSTTDSGLKEEVEVESQGEFTSEEGQDGFCFEEMFSLINRAANLNLTDESTSSIPQDYVTAEYVGNLSVPDPVVARDLEEEVSYLHEFLFGTVNYVPTNDVKAISDDIKYLSGLY